MDTTLDYLPPATNNPFLLVLYLSTGGHEKRKDAPLLLDAFCCAGGAAWGYWLAGYNIIGVDIEHQPNYPFPFIQGDAVQFIREHGQMFDVIHASPPCQAYSRITKPQYRGNHPDLINVVSDELRKLELPYVIENVGGARHLLKNPIMLCGSMYGLDVWRHRYFETSPQLWFAPASCNHGFIPVPVNNSSVQKIATLSEASDAMRIWWMNTVEIRECIPPAYTHWLGTQLMPCVLEKMN